MCWVQLVIYTQDLKKQNKQNMLFAMYMGFV